MIKAKSTMRLTTKVTLTREITIKIINKVTMMIMKKTWIKKGRIKVSKSK